MQGDLDQPIDRKIRCPRDGVVMHKFRLPAQASSDGESSPSDAEAQELGIEHEPQDGVVLDRCHVCCGFWVDLGELEAVLDQSARVARLEECRPPPEYSTETLDCPRCLTQLVRLSHHQQRHLKLDTCTICGGIFFDAQELTDLSVFTLMERIRALFD